MADYLTAMYTEEESHEEEVPKEDIKVIKRLNVPQLPAFVHSRNATISITHLRELINISIISDMQNTAISTWIETHRTKGKGDRQVYRRLYISSDSWNVPIWTFINESKYDSSYYLSKSKLVHKIRESLTFLANLSGYETMRMVLHYLDPK